MILFSHLIFYPPCILILFSLVGESSMPFLVSLSFSCLNSAEKSIDSEKASVIYDTAIIFRAFHDLAARPFNADAFQCFSWLHCALESVLGSCHGIPCILQKSKKNCILLFLHCGIHIRGGELYPRRSVNGSVG